MTATADRIRRHPLTGERLGDIYGYRTLRVDRTTGMVLDGSIEVGYVGQTVQPLDDRDDQHRGKKPGPNGEPIKCQPFSDIIYGKVFKIQEDVPESELDKREAHHIGELMPTYNHQLQAKGNPNRIQISEARRHRDNRDRAKGLEPRVWPALRNPPKFLREPVAARRPARRPLPAKWRRRRNWALLWTASTLALWVGLALLAASLAHTTAVLLPLLPAAAGVVTAAYVPMLHKNHRTTAWVLCAAVTIALAAWAAQGS